MENWKQHLRARMEVLDWPQVAADVAPFILDPEEELDRAQILRDLEAFSG